MNKVHMLKISPEYYKAVVSGRKKFEFRLNDRDFHVRDTLALREYDPIKNVYTGRDVWCFVTYILPLDNLLDGYVILSIEPYSKTEVIGL